MPAKIRGERVPRGAGRDHGAGFRRLRRCVSSSAWGGEEAGDCKAANGSERTASPATRAMRRGGGIRIEGVFVGRLRPMGRIRQAGGNLQDPIQVGDGHASICTVSRSHVLRDPVPGVSAIPSAAPKISAPKISASERRR